MTEFDNTYFSSDIELSPKAFERLSSFIQSELGIKMPPEKRIMLQSRLLKRLRKLQIPNFDLYVAYVFDDPLGREELHTMIGLVSTHKTNFFRESQHFDLMRSTIIDELLRDKSYLKLWSAGCSTGEEVYTLAMVLEEHMLAKQQHFGYDILGTDVAKNVLEHAAKAIYNFDTVEELSLERKKRFFLKHKDPQKPQVRVISNLRQKAHFEWLNLMDTEYRQPTKYDIIFCRNVLIYFERQTQAEVVYRLSQNLTDKGYLFLGHSESIINLKLPLKQLIPTVYQKV